MNPAHSYKLALIEAMKAPIKAAHPNTQFYVGNIPDRPGTAHVLVAGTKWDSTEYATTRTIEEQFTINVLIGTARLTSPQAAMESERVAQDIAHIIQGVVKGNPTLGVAGVYDARFVFNEIDTYPTPDHGWFCVLDGGVAVKARRSI